MSKIKELVLKISEADDYYYNQSKSLVSDKVYDAWKDELTKLDPDNYLVTRVGAPIPITEWVNMEHQVPMPSLNKVNNSTELFQWFFNESDFSVSEKLDGISINTVWENGKLTKAITRGDGFKGFDIKVNVEKMEGIPSKLKSNFSGNIRGEIILRKSTYNSFFKEANYSNVRNAASGIAKRYDGLDSDKLTVIMYTVHGKDFESEKDQFHFLKNEGFIIPNEYQCQSLLEVENVYKKYENSFRESLDYDIDGLVVRINNIKKQLSLGEKNHRPKGAVAFKFESETAETTIQNIVWQVGSTGRITPVAEFVPVELVGAKIERASLYNFSYIKELGLDIGSRVIVSRANDVIPRVEEVTLSTGSVASHPEICPDCNSNSLTFSGEYLICNNKISCLPQKIGRLKIWINKLDILEWGDSILSALITNQIVYDIDDLYRLTVDDIANLNRQGKKSALKKLKILNDNKEITLNTFIAGLGIEGIGSRSISLIMKSGYNSLESILNMTLNQIENIEGFGSVKAKSLFLGLKENEKRIQNLLSVGITIKLASEKLANKSFCFTGSMVKGRKELESLVKNNGGTIKNVSKSLDYLVISDINSLSSKAKKAKLLNILLISEQDFLDML